MPNNINEIRKRLIEEKLARQKLVAEQAAAMGQFNVVFDEIPEIANQDIKPLEFKFKPVPINKIIGREEIIDTVGIELEGMTITQKDVTHILGNLLGGIGNCFRVHRDGSTELLSYIIPVKGKKKEMIINYHTEAAEDIKMKKSKQTSGYELVSVPMDIDTAQIALYSILPRLESCGDIYTERCATHVHVGMAKNLQIAKNLLQLGLWADELFFAISGMGRKFRGYSNNAIYARPLMNGPYFATGDGYYYQCLNYKAALKADSLSEFFAAYGVNYQGEIIKYHPARYFSINLYSILLHGTVEFRHANKSFNPVLVGALTKLCQMFVEISSKVKWAYIKDLEVGNVFELHSTSYYMQKLEKLVSLAENCDCSYKINSRDINELEKSISMYQGIGIKDIAVYTHLRDMVNISNNIIEGGKLNRLGRKPQLPGNTDIHNIGTFSILDKE